MPVMVSEGENRSFAPPPQADLYQAVCYGVWHVGFQEYTYNGKTMPPVDTVIIGWELEEIIPEGEFTGKRYCIYKWYRRSFHEKANLRKDLTAWRNRPFSSEELAGFDLEKVIRINCLLTVGQYTAKTGKPKAKVTGIAPLKKGLAAMVPENSSDMPDWIKKVLAKAIVVSKANGAGSDEEPDAVDSDVEEVPF